LYGWNRYYISYRDYSKDRDKGKIARKRINFWRKIMMCVQLTGFFLGLAAIAGFCFVNL
jgi:hypothetical protein